MLTGALRDDGWRWRLARGTRAALGVVALAALGVALARAPLTWCVALIGGGVGAVLLFRWPWLGLCGLAFSVPFGSLRELALGGVTIGASELLVLGTVSAWILRRLATRQVRLARTRLLWGVVCYIAALGVGLLPAGQLAPALKELAKWAEIALLLVLMASELQPAQQRGLVAALLLGGALQAALGVYQFLFQVGPAGFVLFGRYMRAHGTFQQPNPFAGYLGLLLPLGYGVALTGASDALRGWRAGQGRHAHYGPTLWWVFVVACTTVMAAGLVMSWSRGALMGLAAGAALVLAAMGRRAAVAVALLAVVGVLVAPALAGGVSSDLTDRLMGSLSLTGGIDLAAVEVDDANFASVERLAHWQAAWRMFEQRPWTGVGTGQYAAVYSSVAMPRWQDPLGHAHNYYLNVLAETGLVGLAGYAAFVWAVLTTAWRGARRGSGWSRALGLGALGMLGHLLVHSLVDNLYVHEMYLVVALILGLAMHMTTKQPMKVKANST